MNPHRPVAEIRETLRGRRVVFVGVGDADRGDDGFGPAFVRAMAARDLPEGWSVIDAGRSPENHLGAAARDRPEAVVFVDAAALGAEPGTLGLYSTSDAAGPSPTSHGIPLSTLGAWLRESAGADTLLLVVEPRSLERGESLSGEVSRALIALVEGLTSGGPAAE